MVFAVCEDVYVRVCVALILHSWRASV